VLHPESAPPLLQTLDQRLANFEVLGIEQAIVIPFDRDFASNPAEDFLRDIIHDRLHARKFISAKASRSGAVVEATSISSKDER
jgi:riboflavin kinase/FMN adenylyltransferase